MKKAWFALLIGILFVSACGPSPEAIALALAKTQTSIAETAEAAIPTATNTPIPTSTPLPTSTPAPTDTPPPTATLLPLSKINLEPYLIQSGDLPAGYSGAQVSNDYLVMFQDIGLPKTEYKITQQLERNGESAGAVGVYIFVSTIAARNAQGIIVSTFGDDYTTKKNVDKEYELAYVVLDYTVSIYSFQGVDSSLLYCNTVIFIRMTDTVNATSVENYAARLLERLKTLEICRE